MLAELKTAADEDASVTAAAAAKHGKAHEAQGTAVQATATHEACGKAAASALSAVSAIPAVLVMVPIDCLHILL